jgi:hypothetical protein
VSQPAMRPTITHQIKPNIVSFLYAASWNDVPGGRSQGCTKPVLPILDL